ncbi:hypothetical protein K8R43_01595 [archaeon]|nr:hypothetical protein [archaeon]
MYYDLLVRTSKARETAEELGISTCPHVELEPNQLTRSYEKNKIVFVRGGTLEQNKKTVRSPCDVLLDATRIDPNVVQVAKDNNVTFGITLHQFLYTKQFKRASLIRSYFRLIKLYNKMNSSILLVSGANNNFEVRTPEQLASLGIFLGQTKRQARWSTSKIPENILSKKEVKM